jgi:signal peptidase I
MEPTIVSGDLLNVQLGVNACEIYAAKKDADPPGDIIAFHKPTDPSRLIVHRAVSKITNPDGSCSFATQGDNVTKEDGWQVKESDLIGKVVQINPPFWTYNYVFWVIILAIGIIILLARVIAMPFGGTSSPKGSKSTKKAKHKQLSKV